jgi:hypothetical protein
VKRATKLEFISNNPLPCGVLREFPLLIGTYLQLSRDSHGRKFLV